MFRRNVYLTLIIIHSKYFCFWLAFDPPLIPANRLAPTKFARNSNYQKLMDRNLVPKYD